MNELPSKLPTVAVEAVGIQATNETIHCQGNDLTGIRETLHRIQSRVLGIGGVEEISPDAQPQRPGLMGVTEDALAENFKTIGDIISLLNELERSL